MCGDTGWVTRERDGIAYAARCECFARKYREQLQTAAAIPKRYAHCQIPSFEPANASQKTAADIAFEFVTNFPFGDRGLLFMGPCGVGKTHLAVGILYLLIGEHGVRCRFHDFRELMQALRDSYDPDNPVSEREAIRDALETDVLLLDDLGAEKLTGWVLERLNFIINHRYSRDLVTLITTNYLDKPGSNDESLAERIGQRLRSRLFEMCRTIVITGKDYRTMLGLKRSGFGV